MANERVVKIFVKAKPRTKVPKIEKVDDSHFKISVREHAREGQANIAIQEALAEYLNIAPSMVRLVSGFQSRDKIFEILIADKK